MAKMLNEYASKKILKQYGIPVGWYALAKSREEVASILREQRDPVAMKIISDDIVHKTEAGGVKLNIRGAEEGEAAWDVLLANAKAYKPDAKVEGVLVQRMVPKGVEVIVGGLRDVQFGPVIMFGLGGIFVEIFKDVQFRMAPLTPKEALDLITSIKAFPMLTGARGQAPVNLEALAELIVNTSEFLSENQDVKEIDLNPVICFAGNVQALDASIGYDG